MDIDPHDLAWQLSRMWFSDLHGDRVKVLDQLNRLSIHDFVPVLFSLRDVMSDQAFDSLREAFLRCPVKGETENNRVQEVEIKLKGEGSLVQAHGRIKSTAFALHNCRKYHPDNDMRGLVDLVFIGEEAAFLVCQSCLLRYQVPYSTRTWEDFGRYMDDISKYSGPKTAFF